MQALTNKTKLLNQFRRIWKIPILEALLLKFTEGAKVNSFAYKISPNHYQYMNGSKRVITKQGITYEFDISDMVDWFLYFGFKEEGRLNLEKLNKKGNVFYDIGANIGDISLKAAQSVGNLGSVYSFEPDSRNIEKLKKNVSLNSFDNIHLHHIGLGNEVGSFNLYNIDPNNKGKNRVLEVHDSNLSYETIQIWPLDDYVVKMNIPDPDFIKIDVEGFEFKVLAGAKNILNKSKPILFMEISEKNLRSNDTNPQEIFKFLQELGYQIFDAESMKEIDYQNEYLNCHMDIIGKVH